MRIQIAENELLIEINEKDLTRLSQNYSIAEQFKFSFLDEESLSVHLRMEGNDKLCMMYEDNELIVFLPFTEFESWLDSDNMMYHSPKGMNASNNLDITIKKVALIPSKRRENALENGEANMFIPNSNINYN